LAHPLRSSLNRDFSYSDAEILAKEAEEATLHRAMEQDPCARCCAAWVRQALMKLRGEQLEGA
jgi:outer membrane lipopolysaccharide assembly protein LptE/RlpB